MDELSAFVASQEGETPEAEVKVKKKKGKGKTKVDENGNPIPKKEPKPRRDNIEYVKNLPSISGVRTALQISVAKKAKSAGRQEAIERYEGEIEAAKERLAELLAQADGAENIIAKLIELDEDQGRIITHFIKMKEKDRVAFEEEYGKIPKALLKTFPNDIPQAFFDELGFDFVEELQERHNRKDFRLQSVCRVKNFIDAFGAGQVGLVDGKFKLPQEGAPVDVVEE